MSITELWNLLFFNPMLNGLVLLSQLFLGNFGLTIIAFTIIIRLLILPLTLKQLKASKAMSTLQPKIQELQRRFGKDRERLSKETMALYKEHGVNPLGCAVPTLVQFPIWIGLYQAITYALSDRPEGYLNLSQHLYGLDIIHRALPVENAFLWLNLAKPDPFYIMPILVAGSMWVQQKMMTLPTTDGQQAQMNQMMQWMMPLMFGFFTLQVTSGLGLYWVVSNIISMVLQYFVTGWGSLLPRPRPATPAPATPAPAPQLKARGGRRKK